MINVFEVQGGVCLVTASQSNRQRAREKGSQKGLHNSVDKNAHERSRENMKCGLACLGMEKGRKKRDLLN